MASYIPKVKIPVENILQEMDYARGRPPNRNSDVMLPSYILDRLVVKAIQYENSNYLEAYIKRCPTYISRYFFIEKVIKLKPLTKTIQICTLLGFACLYKSYHCLKSLMKQGAKPLQPSYIVEWTTSADGEHIIELFEKPSIILLASIFHSEDIKHITKTFCLFKQADVNLGNFIELRQQHLQQPRGPTTKTVQYHDVWECFEREIEASQGPTLVFAKVNLKKIRSAYSINKLDQLLGIHKSKSKGKITMKPKDKESDGEAEAKAGTETGPGVKPEEASEATPENKPVDESETKLQAEAEVEK